MELLQLLILGIAQGCVYGLIALGFVLIYKATELVNFAQGELMMLGAFMSVTFINILGFNYWVGFALSVLFMGGFGYVLEMLVLRRVMGQPQFSVVILTIALGFVFRFLAGIVWGQEPAALSPPYSGELIELQGLIVSQEHLAIILGTVLLSGCLFLFFRYTRIGVAMQASSQNQLAAYYMGIPVKQVCSLIWAISAMVSAVAGTLIAPISLVQTQMGFLGIKAFAAAVIGGFGSLPGTLIGGLIVGSSEQLAGAYLPAGFKEISAYLIMLFALVLRPEGFFAQVYQKKM